MAKDVTTSNKNSSSVSNPTKQNNGAAVSSPMIDQKVPPLRIVLNTAGNQKVSVNKTSTSLQPSDNDQSKSSSDVKSSEVAAPNNCRVPNKVRIKLSSKQNNSNNDQTHIETDQNTNVQDNIIKEDKDTVIYSHLRRITRRSQRSNPVLTNEDEASMTSITSTDENSTHVSAINLNTDNEASLDDNSNSGTQVSSRTVGNVISWTNATGNSNSGTADTPKRHKRRKCEPSESQSTDYEHFFNHINYKPPNQNSFILYKNIRKQVEEKLRNLNVVQPKIPFGMKDYLIARGTYLLDGNKLGNGTNLNSNEDGGIFLPSLGKYHIRGQSRFNYNIPKRAKVPIVLPTTSPLYNLFVEQEKDRYKMRMQHLKEREKLTLAAEQEIIRVYSQAALAAANQDEPFSACTMLKHQEIYNNIDCPPESSVKENSGSSSREDRIRNRRREEAQTSDPITTNQGDAINDNPNSLTRSPQSDSPSDDSKKSEQLNAPIVKSDGEDMSGVVDNIGDSDAHDSDAMDSDSKLIIDDKQDRDDDDDEDLAESKMESDFSITNTTTKENIPTVDEVRTEKPLASSSAPSESVELPLSPDSDNSGKDKNKVEHPKNASETKQESEVSPADLTGTQITTGEPNCNEDLDSAPVEEPAQMKSPKSELDKSSEDIEVFLTKLQEIDDKWDKIREHMLIRHRNEAESLHAVQRLEWEWKIKEAGICDIIINQFVDSNLVPKLDIHSHDY